jgi:hypothetical protein
MRANLAEEATNVIRTCISYTLDPAIDSSGISNAGKFRQAIRNAIAIEHVVEVVGLTEKLDDFIIAPRSLQAVDLEENVPNKPSLLSFASFERDLW